ncbi:hypothetical protein IWQ60_008210 [Tieghemiomyces parasiticus]|uniref:Reverse transcriptase domain-containing protein n=1 Tax=Tieghemiomyces parasiticus TaxID=78921 RepID=A0A9W7ZTM0_9FUNG|nr:hypothetical protein IWQ60_008210 [Tieghemiomyces parasiticus]
MASHDGAHSIPLAQAYLDLKAAYDTVPINGMLSKLAAKACPAPIFQVVQALFTNEYSKVAVNDLGSEDAT